MSDSHGSTHYSNTLLGKNKNLQVSTEIKKIYKFGKLKISATISESADSKLFVAFILIQKPQQMMFQLLADKKELMELKIAAPLIIYSNYHLLYL